MNLTKLKKTSINKEKTALEKFKIFFLGYNVSEEEKQLDRIKFNTYYEKGSGERYKELESTPNILSRIRNKVVDFFEENIKKYRENKIISKRKKYFQNLNEKADDYNAKTSVDTDDNPKKILHDAILKSIKKNADDDSNNDGKKMFYDALVKSISKKNDKSND